MIWLNITLLLYSTYTKLLFLKHHLSLYEKGIALSLSLSPGCLMKLAVPGGYKKKVIIFEPHLSTSLESLHPLNTPPGLLFIWHTYQSFFSMYHKIYSYCLSEKLDLLKEATSTLTVITNHNTVKALVSGITGTKGMPDIRKFQILEGSYQNLKKNV